MSDTPRPRFDPTINLGHVLSILSFVGMAIAAYGAMRSDIHSVETRMATVEKTATDLANSMTRLTDVVVSAARQDEQMKALSLRIDRIERDRRSVQ
jgi:hypothetical protein